MSTAPGPRLLFVCSGNATRSVIAEALVRRDRPQWPVSSAGTWAIPGLASSHRTIAALESVGVSAPGHRSRLLEPGHLAAADLVIAFELDHIRRIRRLDPEAAARTMTLRRLAELDGAGAIPGRPWRPPTEIGDEPGEQWMETPDPAGGDVPDFIACARAIDADLSRALSLLDRW